METVKTSKLTSDFCPNNDLNRRHLWRILTFANDHDEVKEIREQFPDLKGLAVAKCKHCGAIKGTT